MAETLTEQDVWARYVQAAMRGAEYETIEDGTVFGHIPGFQGAWANAPTPEACAVELAEVLYDWAVFRLEEGLMIPAIPEIPRKRSKQGRLHDGGRISAAPGRSSAR